MGFAVTSTVLRAEVAELTHWATDALGLPDSSKGVILERLRFIDGKAALYVADYLPAQFADAALSLSDEEDGSLYDRLEQQTGTTVYERGRRTLEAVHAEARVTEMLGVKSRTPLMFIESVSWDAELQPFHAFQSWLRTDRIRVEVQVTRTQSVDARHGTNAFPLLAPDKPWTETAASGWARPSQACGCPGGRAWGVFQRVRMARVSRS